MPAKKTGSWIHIVRRHTCNPPDADKALLEYEVGSVWKCAECGRTHKLGVSQRDGGYYERAYDYEVDKRPD